MRGKTLTVATVVSVTATCSAKPSRGPNRARRRGRWPLGWIALGLGLAGCGGVEPVAVSVPLNDATVYASLEMNHHIATISTVAPYDTIQLSATPRDLSGAPIAGLPAPVYFTPDTAAVSVTADGLVHAKLVRNGVNVIASLSLSGNVRHADTIVVDITNVSAPPRLASLTLPTTGSDFSTPDSSIAASTIDFTRPLSLAQEVVTAIDNSDFGLNVDPYPMGAAALGREAPFDVGIYVGCNEPTCAPITLIQGLDSAGNAMPALPVELRGLDPKIATPSGTYAGAHAFGGGFIPIPQGTPGSARFEVRATAYGITMVDTVTWTIKPPSYAMVYWTPTTSGSLAFAPDQIKISTHGAVMWWNWSRDAVNIVFDDPTNVAMPSAEICQIFTLYAGDVYRDDVPHCGVGDLGMPKPDLTLSYFNQASMYGQMRQFPVAGTYRFHDAATGKAGVIVVSDD